MANALKELFGSIADAIRVKTGDTATMKPAEFPDNILGIAVGGGSSSDVRYVTFTSHDGAAEYGKKAVAVGDDCADPIARGVFSTPIRESTPQYSYTFTGWGTEANGGVDADWNKAVTEDRTVYANFISAVRYYTVTYYDDDGVTVLKTESLAYGTTPSYTPGKENFGFAGWKETVTPVTADAAYTAQWTEVLTFANASWEQIAAISAAGQAEEYFSLNDTKTVVINGVTTTARIVAFNHDDLANGSGKAGITMVTGRGVRFDSLTTYKEESTYNWGTSQTRTLLNSGAFWNAFPAELRSVIKSVTKTSNKGYKDNSLFTTNDKVWMLSASEVGCDNEADNTYVATGQGQQYPVFTGAASRVFYNAATGKAQPYYLRSMHVQYYASSAEINTSGVLGYSGTMKTQTGGNLTFVLGFCI